MQLIDKAAQALARTQGCYDWDSLSAEKQKSFRCGVRAVFEAVRSPDTGMAEAGAEIIRNVGPAETESAYLSDAADMWSYMIDVLLGQAG